jgi:hypothetical protein
MPIGQLLIELGVNMGAFTEGLSKATYQTKQFGKDVEKTFNGLSRNVAAVGAAFGAFGPAGAELAGALTAAGSAAGAAINHFAGTSKTLGVFAGAAAGATAAALSLAGATVALVAHTAKEMKDMGEMARATGMSTEAFTELAFAAKQAQSDIDPEALSKGLSRLNRAAFDAAEGSSRMQAAFKQMGVSVQNANGSMKPTIDILLQMSDSFSKMPDGVEKTALAMQVAGRGGAQFIALMNMGPEKMRAFMTSAHDLGIAFNDEAAEGAAHFVQSLNFLEAAGQGVSNQLTTQLAPVLANVADEVLDSFKSNNSDVKGFITGLTDIVKVTIDVGATVVTVFEIIGKEIGLVANLMVDASHIMSNGWKSTVGLMKNDFNSFADDSMGSVSALIDLVRGKTSGSAEASGIGKKTSGSGKPVSLLPPVADETDTAKEFIARSDEQADAQDRVAQAINGTTAAIAVQKALSEADNTTTEQRLLLQNKLVAVQSKLSGEGTLSSEARGNYVKQAAQLQSYLAELDQAQGKISEDFVRKAIGGIIAQDAEEMATAGDKYQEQIAAVKALAAAYEQGDQAVAAANLNKGLESEVSRINELKKAISGYVITVGTVGHLQGMVSSLQELEAEMAKHKTQLQDLASAQIDADIAKEANDVKDQAEAYKILAAAADQSADARMRADAQAAGLKLKTQGGTSAQQGLLTGVELEKARQEQGLSDARKGAEMDLMSVYANEVDELERIKSKYADNATVQLIASAQLYDEQNKINKQWDEAALKVGGMGDKVHAALDEVRQSGQEFGAGLVADFTKAVDEINDQLVKLTVTGKSNFKEMRQGLESSLLSTGLKKLESSGAGQIEKLFGGKGSTKPDGSQNNPFYTLPANGILGGLRGGAAGAIGDLPTSGFNFGGLKSLFGGATGAQGGAPGGTGGGILGLLGGIFKTFSGFLADGGSVTPGKTYVVGEKHPEFFTPGATGQVSPTVRLGGGNVTNVNNMHLHGVSDADSFRKNQNQIMSTFTNGIGQAARRR